MQKYLNYAAVAAAAVLIMSPVASRAATVVEVSLFDQGAAAEMPTGNAFAKSTMDMSKATMGIKVSEESVKAGKITFKVTNDSKENVHEMIVIYLTDPTKPLPYVDK